MHINYAIKVNFLKKIIVQPMSVWFLKKQEKSGNLVSLLRTVFFSGATLPDGQV